MMKAPGFKHTNEALAFITLYKAMSPEIKEEVKAMIVDETNEAEALMFTTLSLQSWDLENEALEESELWENFYNQSKDVV
ncbi:hypothetical protein [Mucilaginibacter arboris]|uniref:Uncharacterized protein n=1 Tax=Mucilaginibacter arboris TaxID=2682090 RepID=A0A7K1T080_9SPHI|nr:hypothetical protein [Mucilaginibacter arboris]MVN22928.1 hypothetical protein [Mucilaginibacter arboris]